SRFWRPVHEVPCLRRLEIDHDRLACRVRLPGPLGVRSETISASRNGHGNEQDSREPLDTPHPASVPTPRCASLTHSDPGVGNAIPIESNVEGIHRVNCRSLAGYPAPGRFQRHPDTLPRLPSLTCEHRFAWSVAMHDRGWSARSILSRAVEPAPLPGRAGKSAA